MEQFAARTHGTLGLPERRAPVVAERVQRADVGQRDDFVAAKPRARDEIVEGAEPSAFTALPLSAFAVWFLNVKGNYQSVEKIFLFACIFYVTYVISGFLVKPDWKEAAIYSVKPVLLPT